MTRRLDIAELLKKRELPVKNIANLFEVQIKDIVSDLEHIAKSVRPDYKLYIRPAECKKCGFVFRHREKVKAPSKCPKCRSERIDPPLFSIKPTRKIKTENKT